MNNTATLEPKSVCDKVLIGAFDMVLVELPKNYFDCVIFNDELEHIYSPWSTIKSVRGLLTVKGVIVSSIPNFRYITNIITEIIWEGEFTNKPEDGILDDTHIRFFTSESNQRIYKERAYEIVSH